MASNATVRDDCGHLTPSKANCTHENFHNQPIGRDFKECRYCPRYRSTQLTMFSTSIDYDWQAEQWRINNPGKWADLVKILDGIAWECTHTKRKALSVRQAEMKLADIYHEAVNHNYTKYHGKEYQRIRPQYAHLIKTRN